MDTEEMKDWIYQNLMIRSEIIEEYEVKPSYIDIAISRGKIKPFIKKGSRIALYLRSDVESYLWSK
ncbi:hypothetical protein KJB49_11445 [Staphylococcus chromogenes]|uniref:hypothetical protein n=1 Tax=Staphylococcus chromogenes TaxID=46126 RepID=UPI000D044159|nr:hypothetical protein [Staphylococcus chromogenes]HDG8798299.1 hypothetical protein [Staphylococcus aureus]MCE4971874.1 hypothetical protein [Staphylococcus chromogenes]MDU0465786.1 hypothetical protein [Staphylococcus chromogenes]PTF99287.1 hypothetical protein BU666_06970 [Staphylococcus chromogenes]PTG50321.1 hypothetical protein BU687_10945 [Staphylococcus chromogenes]